MGGTKEGGARAAATNMARYGADYYSRIGTKGGSISRGGGFIDRELAASAGKKGGATPRMAWTPEARYRSLRRPIGIDTDLSQIDLHEDQVFWYAPVEDPGNQK